MAFIEPMHRNKTQYYLLTLNNLLKHYLIVQVWRLVEVNNFHQIGGDSSDDLFRISDDSLQMEGTRFSQEFHYASLGNCLEEGIQWVSCVVFVTTFL